MALAANNNVDPTYRELVSACATEEDAVIFARDRGLISSAATNVRDVRAVHPVCFLGTAGCLGTPYDTTRMDRGKTRQIIRCRGCKRSRVAGNKVIQQGSALAAREAREPTSAPVLLRFQGKVGLALEVIYLWSHKQSVSQVLAMVGQDPKRTTVERIFHHLRDLCREALHAAPPMGGPGYSVVSIVEALMRGKRKANKGRQLLGDRIRGARQRNHGNAVDGPWVFGLACRTPDGLLELRMFYVRKRDRATLMPIVQRNVAPGAEVHSDEWRAYANLSTWSVPQYVHKTVNHSENFVDPGTGAHTQRIESCWGHVKTAIRRMRHGAKGNLSFHLAEEWWRRFHARTPFAGILEEVRRQRER